MGDAAMTPKTDWSDLPDVYVTSAKQIDSIVWEIIACSVPMAIGPEVRLIRSDKARVAAEAAQAALRAERDNLSDKLELERALTDGAHRRARAADAEAAALRAKVEALETALRAEREESENNLDCVAEELATEWRHVETIEQDLAATRAESISREMEWATIRDELVAEAEALRAKVEALETANRGLQAAFRVNMLRYGPQGTSHRAIDAALAAAAQEVKR